jgi:hypothetical protein
MTTTRDTMERMWGFSSLFCGLLWASLSFLPLADRFGLWGAFGWPNVFWGSFARFVAYTGIPHSVFRIEVGEAKILIDPFLSDNPSRDNGWSGYLTGKNSTQGGDR